MLVGLIVKIFPILPFILQSPVYMCILGGQRVTRSSNKLNQKSSKIGFHKSVYSSLWWNIKKYSFFLTVCLQFLWENCKHCNTHKSLKLFSKNKSWVQVILKTVNIFFLFQTFWQINFRTRSMGNLRTIFLYSSPNIVPSSRSEERLI